MIPIPACRVLVAPRDGRLSSHLADGATVELGDVIGTLESNGGVTRLVAPERGRVGGALVSLRQSVAAGEGVLWLARA